MPYRPNGLKASSTDPTTWTSFEAAQAAHFAQPEVNRGVGFFFAEDDGLCGVDLDTSVDADGAPYAWAAEILDRFSDTYTAFSVSGTGVHILCRAQLEKGRNYYVPEGPSDANGKPAQIGLFDRARFFALTGRPLSANTLAIVDHQEDVEWLLSRMQKRVREQPSTAERSEVPLSDDVIVQKAIRAKNGAKFERLWKGQWAADYDSQSESDSAFCCMLAFSCQGDAAKMEELFAKSGLARDKWLERKDYRDSTIANALAQTTRYYSPEPRQQKKPGADEGESFSSAPDEPASTVPDVPRICVAGRQLPDITAEALDALRVTNEPPILFARSGRIVRVATDECGRVAIGDLTEHGLRGHLARAAYFFKVGARDKTIECSPSIDIVRDIQSRPAREWGLPPLDLLIQAPAIRSDGSIICRAGYDPATFLYYSPAPGLTVPDIPENVTAGHVQIAMSYLESAFGDFVFKDAASRANLFASLLTPFVRSLIDGPTPLAIYDAPQAGTGNSLLAESVMMIATGRPPDTFSAPRDPEEWRKKITTMLVAGSPVVVIDNVEAVLDSDALCSALTAMMLSDRRFGTFEQITLPVRCAWIATGNNVRLGGDMPRRAYWIRLDAQSSRPFQRTGFRHDNLREWVKTNRGTLIAALLVIARYWFVKGCPNPNLATRMGSYESWCKVVGGILECAGIRGFLENAEAKLATNDVEEGQWEEFLLAIERLYREEPFKAADVAAHLLPGRSGEMPDVAALRQSMPDAIAECLQRREASLTRVLGNAFSTRVDRRYGDRQVHITRGPKDTKSKVERWQVSVA